MKIIVVGSGPAGISVATGLLERGYKVTLLDAGNTLEPEKQTLLADIQNNKSPISALSSPVYAKRKLKLPYGSNFIYDHVKNYFSWQLKNCYLPNSFAQGGLSNVWGGALNEFSTAELAHWPKECQDLSAYYATVISWFKNFYSNETEKYLSHQALHLKNKWQKNYLDLLARGFTFQTPALAADFKQCRLCGVCQHGCPYELIYHTSIHLDFLKTQPNFTYINNLVVKNFSETSEQVQLCVKSLENNQTQTMHADRLFIACGAGLSSLLYLRALNKPGKKLVLKDSQHFFLPCLTEKKFKNMSHEDLHTLCQLKLKVSNGAITQFPAHLQLYTYMDLYQSELQNKLKNFYFIFKPFLKIILDRLVVFQGYLDSRESTYLTIKYKQDNQFQVQAKRSSQVAGRIHAVVSYLQKNKKILALQPLQFLLGKSVAGYSNHVGASLPMSHDPQKDEVNIWGVPKGFNQIHFVDGSILPSIPAGPITLTIMANAYRIGKEAPL